MCRQSISVYIAGGRNFSRSCPWLISKVIDETLSIDPWYSDHKIWRNIESSLLLPADYSGCAKKAPFKQNFSKYTKYVHSG